MFRLALLMSVCVAFPAIAQEPAPCVKRTDFLSHLSSNYNEAPVALGLTASGRVLEVVASERGTWTIIVTMPNGVSCGIASGEHWELVKEPMTKGPST